MADNSSTASNSTLNFGNRDQRFARSESDKSSFYGGPCSEDVKRKYAQQLSEFDNDDYRRVHNWNIQVIVAKAKRSNNNKRKRQDSSSQSSKPELKKHRFSMESKVEFKTQGQATIREPFNPYEGYSTALQIGEPMDDFLQRLPPSNSSVSEPWIWCANFGTNYRDIDRRFAEFKQTGTRLLEQFSQRRKSLEDSFDPPKHPGAINRMLQPDRNQLQNNILEAAKDCRITTGKWMLFATHDKIDQLWAAVVRATVDGHLGISAKVSTKPSSGSDSTHIICVYAQDFDDQADLKRILKRLVQLGLAAAVPGPLPKGGLNAQKQIYFKADAYTWLEIMGDNEYKLKASMYSTASLLTKADVAELR